jgi:hypothetical protein
MTTLRNIFVVFVLFCTSIAAKAQTADEKLALDAGKLFEQREYLRAYPMYSQLVSLYPNHPEYHYKFGACGIYADPDKMNAVRYLQGAIKKGETDPMAYYFLGKALHLNYQFKEAISAYENFMRFADAKVIAKTDARREVETCIYGANLLANIKDVTVLSKTETDRSNFFRYYNLEGIGGKILAVPEALMTKLDKKSNEPGVMYYPGNGTTVYYSSYGKDGKSGKDIYKAEVLPDGSFSNPQKLNNQVNSIYDEDYCFMHSDGKTLYFASRGHNSMGGYDIFKSELDPSTGEFGPAVNLDFAINTPDDDIFYIADKDNHAAFFASGRSSDNNHLNVYQVLVETNPIQVVYFKGAYMNTVDGEELGMSTKILDGQGNRMVCEGNSDLANGNYILYVPKSGEYRYQVRTAMSPEVFDVSIQVPSFAKPVAIRQEMTLKSVSGKYVLDVQTYFDQPLQEDLSLLAAEMLRKKSKLEVGNQAEVTAMDGEERNGDGAISTYAQDMEHVAINAGFNEGTSIATVMTEMTSEIQTTNQEITESKQTQLVALAYASKCQQEADAFMKQAEEIRQRVTEVKSSQDAEDLRKSVQLVDAAEEKMREAKSALMVNKSEVAQTSELEKTKKNQEKRLADLKVADNKGDYNASLTLLQTEKEFRNQQSVHVDSRKDSIRVAMNNKEKTLSNMENQLMEMKQNVTDLEKRKEELTNQVNSTSKSKEKEALREQYIQASSSLDAERTQMLKFEKEVNKNRDELSMLTAQLEFEVALEQSPTLGIQGTSLTALSPTEQRLLEMRVDEILSRKDAIAITDVALLSYIENEQLAPSVNTSSNESVISPMLSAESKSEFVNAFVEDSALPFSTSVALISLEQDYERISAKIANNTATEQERAQMTEVRNGLQEKKEALRIADAQLEFNQEAQEAIQSVEPSYQDNLLAIHNNDQHGMKQALQSLEYKTQVLEHLEEARKENAQSIQNGSTREEVIAAAQRDAALAAAITELNNDVENIQSIRAAYEQEIKVVIENDAVYREKLMQQTSTTQAFIVTLDEAIAFKEAQVNTSVDAQEKATFLKEIDVLKNDKLQAEAKIQSYQNDMLLLGSASDPLVTDVKSSSDVTDGSQAGASTLSVDELKSEAKAIQTMFKAKDENQSIFAYESGIFAELVASYGDDAHPIQNIEKIQEINDQIFLIEAEMENEKGKGALKKLDYKAEQLYFQRSQLEISNASSVAFITKEAYDQEAGIAEQAIAENQAFIQSRMVLRDEIARLQTESDRLMEEAAEIRFNAPSIQDEIEKADAYRTAFAKEALAIEQMRQVQQICRNAEPLSSYTEQDLVMLRTGTVPAHLLAEAQRRDDASSLDITLRQDGDQSTLDISNDATTLTNVQEKTADNSSSNTIEITQENEAMNAGNSDVQNTSEVIELDGSAQIDATISEQVDQAGVIANDVLSNDSEAENALNANPTRDDVTNSEVEVSNEIVKTEIQSESINTEVVEETLSNERDGSNSADVTVERPLVEVQDASETMIRHDESVAGGQQDALNTPLVAEQSRAEEEQYNAADFYYNMPSQVRGTIFQMTSAPIYSEERPIPVDAQLPQGLYFKVQVGAFRNRIPQDLFEGFAPICGEAVNSGITRYTAGFFVAFDAANEVKKQIRSMGYSDAFVVAFKDGKRIPMYEALGYGSQQEMDVAFGIVPANNKDAAANTSIDQENRTTDNRDASNEVNNGNAQGQKQGSGDSNANQVVVGSAQVQEQTTPLRSVDQIMLEEVEVGYYKPAANDVKAQEVEVIEGLFYTVQVGVFSKPVSADRLFNIAPLNSELTDTKKIRYTTGQFTSLADAVQKRNDTRGAGITDAFITAYYNGRRITLGEADQLLAEKGPGILKK